MPNADYLAREAARRARELAESIEHARAQVARATAERDSVS